MEVVDIFAKWALIFCVIGAITCSSAVGVYMLLSGACVARPGETVSCPE